MNSSVVRKVWWVLIALISALAFAAAVNTGSAHAVSQSRAQTIADYYGAKWCPHHKWGVCLRRVATVFPRRWPDGRKSGAWDATVQGWESSFFDPFKQWWLARWYYERCVIIFRDGSLHDGRWC
jgi:hypothetical protein